MGNAHKLRAKVIHQGTPKETVDDRETTYGDAWKKTGQIMSFLMGDGELVLPDPLFSTTYVFAWMMILNKLVRAITSPNNPDHWLDIAGYATLVYEEVKREASETLSSQ